MYRTKQAVTAVVALFSLLGLRNIFMLRLFAIAAVALMMGTIGVSVGDASITSYLTSSRSMPHAVSTFFYGLSGR